MPKGANYEIKTTLSIDGEKDFKAAMEDANRAMRVHNADLRAMAAEYEYTDDKQKYFAQRADVVNQKMRQQEAIVESLSGAVKESADMFGSASAKTDGYRIQLSNATAKLFEMRQESEKAQRELEELGRDSPKVGRQIENGIGDAAEETAEKLDSMFDKVAQDVNALKSSVGFQVGMDLAGSVIDAMQSAIDFVQESREYRRAKSFAEQSARRNNLDVQEVERYANEIAVFFGDYDAAVETVAVLTEAGFKGETLGMAVDNLIGAAIAYYNTLNTESLAESIQETIATGELTGQYAELIDRLQGQTTAKAEDIEKSLKKAKTEDEKLAILMAPLTEAGMQSNKFDYEARNAELLKAAEAERALQEAWANLAAEIEPIVTAIVTGTTSLVDGLTEVIERIKNFNNTVLTEGIEVPIQQFAEEIEKTLTNKEYAKKNLEKTYPEFENALNSGELDSFGGAWNYIISHLFPSAGAEELPKTELQDYGFKAAQEMATGVMKGVEENATVDAAVKTALYQMDAKDSIDQAMTAGQNLMTSFGNGIAAGTSVPLENVRNMVNQINAMLAQISMPAFGLGWSGITGGNVYLYNNQQNAAKALSTTIGRGVQTKLLVR